MTTSISNEAGLQTPYLNVQRFKVPNLTHSPRIIPSKNSTRAFVAALLLSATCSGFAQTRSSANYSVSAETLDGGGHPASSANYSSVASVEPGAVGNSAGSVYSVQHGFFAVEPAANQPPLAEDDNYSMDEDGPLIVSAPGVLANDSDPDANTFQAALDSGTSHGALSLNADGSFSYTPETNFHGTDSFTYRASDGTDGTRATVHITINPVNDLPVFALGGDVSVDEDSGAYSASQATGVDDGDPEIEQALTFNVSNDSSLFSVRPAITPDGTLTFTPAPDAVGSAVITVTLTDDNAAGGDALTTASQSFTITLRDKTPPVITLLGEAAVSHEAGQTYTDAGAIATDNLDGDLTSKIAIVNPVDENTPGIYTVTYDVSDEAGHAATQITRTVTVVDTTAPQFLTFPEDVDLDCGGDTAPSATGEPTTTDNASGEVTLTYEDTIQGSCPARITRTWAATDAGGNTTSKVQHIHLLPGGAPTLNIGQGSPGFAVISWTPASTNWFLQERLSLTSGGWINSPSGATNPVVVPTTPPMKYYRLFKP